MPTGDVAGERLGEGSLVTTDVAFEHEQRRPVPHAAYCPENGAVVILAPPLDQSRLQDQLGLLRKPRLDVIQADQLVVAPVGVGIGEVEVFLEQVGGAGHATNILREAPLPSTE